MFRNLVRKLHNPLYIPENIDEMVVIGNNSMVFTTYSVFNQFNRNSYPKITWIYPNFWLDRVHSDYMNLDWGQTIYGLPSEVRSIFTKFRPNYPDTKFIQWHEFQQTRLLTINELKKNKNFHFYKGEPQSIIPKSNHYEFTINSPNISNKIHVSKNSFFYNWYRYPNIQSPYTLSHTALYEQPRSQIAQEIIVLGHGLSIIWLLKHFPKTKFINIKRENDTLPNLPANSDINIQKEIKNGRLVIYVNDAIDLRVDDKTRTAIILNHEGMILHEAPIYSATGFVPNYSFIEKIPKDKILSMPLFELSDEIEGKKISKVLENPFIAPKNIPIGSLAQSYTHLMDVTKNVSWTNEPMFFYKKSRYDLLKSEFKKNGIDLKSPFFEKIDLAISELDNPLNPELALSIYEKTFKETCNPNIIESEIFDKLIKKFFNIPSLQEILNEETLSTNRPK